MSNKTTSYGDAAALLFTKVKEVTEVTEVKEVTVDTDDAVALLFLLIYMDSQSLDWLVICGKTKQQAYKDKINKEITKATQRQAPIANSAVKADEALYQLGKLGFEGFKSKIQKDSLSWPLYYFKQLFVWILLLAYALGCAVTAFSALLEKFVKGKAIPGYSLGRVTLLPAIGVASLSTLHANILLMKSDVEAFIDKIVGLFRGNAGKLTARSVLGKSCAIVLSAMAAVIFGLITWHFLAVIPAKYIAAKYVLVAGTIATELMLTYGLINDDWVPIFRAIKSPVDGKSEDKSESKVGGLKKRYLELGTGKKILFLVIFCALSAFLVYGMVGLCSVGATAAMHISFLHQLPIFAIKLLLAVAVVTQLPLYLMPAADASLSLSELSVGKIKTWFGDLPDAISSALSNITKINKVKFGLCWLGGALAIGVAIAFIPSLGTTFLFGAATWYAIPFVCIPVGLVYGAWLYMNHVKNGENYSPIAANAVVQGSLEALPLERVAAGSGSFLCCSRSMLASHRQLSETMEAIKKAVSPAVPTVP